MEAKAFFDPNTFTVTYVVFDPRSGDALVIDPVLDYDPLSSQTSLTAVNEVADFVRENKLTLHYVIETHAHADHLSASQVLKRWFGAQVAIGEHITVVQETFKQLFNLPAEFPTDGSQFDRLLKDDEVLTAGTLKLQIIPTPGHTPACVSILVNDEALFTGDALFMEDYGTGRTDFPRGDAAALYSSVHERIYRLPERVRIFVGHDYLPHGRELRYESSVGVERRENIQLRAETNRDQYVAFRTQRDATLRPPRLLFQSVQVNINAGMLPSPAANGLRYLHIPLNAHQPTDDVGESA